MPALADICIHLINQSARAGLHINVRTFTAHVGLHPTRM
jgi:hypothetical protein